MIRTAVATFPVYLVPAAQGDLFACTGCLSAEAREALGAVPVTAREMRRTTGNAQTACCALPVERHDRDDYRVTDAD